MKNSNVLILSLLFLVIIALGCSWSFKRNEPTTNTTSNASTPEPAGTPSSSGGEVEIVSAEPLIAELYKLHDADKGPFRDHKRSTIDKYFAKPLADLIWKNDQRTDDEMGAIEADPLYDAQDIEIKRFSVGKAVADGDKASVTVSFENYSEKKSIVYSLVREGDAWKIADIKYPGGYSLVKIFREHEKAMTVPAEPSAPGEFEGKYRVGETTCVVNPVKMAFAIKWAKGSGSEYFFYKDANVFESEEDKSGGRNEFRFDDENYNTGTFVRADGRTFPVRRAG
ncbi:MAG: DUF3828 domain-containing protein [Pyrinomonadaceae bacterium]